MSLFQHVFDRTTFPRTWSVIFALSLTLFFVRRDRPDPYPHLRIAKKESLLNR